MEKLYNVDLSTSFAVENCFMLNYDKYMLLYNKYMYIDTITVLVIAVISANTENVHGLSPVKNSIYMAGYICMMDFWDLFNQTKLPFAIQIL